MALPTPKIEMLPVTALRPYSGNARRHSRKQVRQIADSIARFGFTNPVLVSDEGEIIAGHGRVMAAKDLGLATVPTVRLSHLTGDERRAYVLADNKLALNAGWDTEILAIELQALIDLDFDVTLTGFSLAEIDLTLDQAGEATVTATDSPADSIPEPPSVAVSRPGDLWRLGRHRLLCGDARYSAHVARLVGSEKADLIFTDPPYNVPIDGHVGGLDSVRHREFAFASGEMTRSQFTAFLTQTLSNAATAARDGAIAFVCMDWRHIRELLDAGEAVFSGAEEPLRLEQDQWRHGKLLSLEARTRLRVQGRDRTPHQQLVRRSAQVAGKTLADLVIINDAVDDNPAFKKLIIDGGDQEQGAGDELGFHDYSQSGVSVDITVGNEVRTIIVTGVDMKGGKLQSLPTMTFENFEVLKGTSQNDYVNDTTGFKLVDLGAGDDVVGGLTGSVLPGDVGARSQWVEIVLGAGNDIVLGNIARGSVIDLGPTGDGDTDIVQLSPDTLTKSVGVEDELYFGGMRVWGGARNIESDSPYATTPFTGLFRYALNEQHQLAIDNPLWRSGGEEWKYRAWPF